jgi:Putative metallopeptidase
MKCVMSLAAVIVALMPAAFVTGAAAQAPAPLRTPQIEIAYVQPRNAAFQPIQERLKKRQVLEQLKQFLTPLRLPQKLTVQFDQCGAASRAYKPQAPATICYEMIEQIERVAIKAAPDAREMVLVGTVVQAVLHEVAHAIFDILQVPVWGRSKDAADMLAAFIMLQFGEDVARQTILGTAVFWELSGKSWTGSAFADTGSPEPQRYFNYLCIAYGGAPKSFEHLAKAEEGKKPIIPEDRAKRCSREYHQFRKAFDLRIMPYVDPDLLVQVRAKQWLLPSEGK